MIAHSPYCPDECPQECPLDALYCCDVDGLTGCNLWKAPPGTITPDGRWRKGEDGKWWGRCALHFEEKSQ